MHVLSEPELLNLLFSLMSTNLLANLLVNQRNNVDDKQNDMGLLLVYRR